MQLRDVECGTIIEIPKNIRTGKTLIQWGAGAVLRENEYPKNGFLDCVLGKEKQHGLFLCLPYTESTDHSSYIQLLQKTLAELEDVTSPVIVQFTILTPPSIACAVAQDSRCDAVMTLDEISWEAFPEEARKVFFRTQHSPFKKSGGGYISGKYLNSFTAEWIRQCRRDGLHKPIIAGGGVLRPRDVDPLIAVGAESIGIESARILRPWNVFRIQKRLRDLFVGIQ